MPDQGRHRRPSGVPGPSVAPSLPAEAAGTGSSSSAAVPSAEVAASGRAGSRSPRVWRGPWSRHPGLAARTERPVARDIDPADTPPRSPSGTEHTAPGRRPAAVNAPLVPGPVEAARTQALLQEMHGWLLAGYAADAAIRAAALAELALGVLAGVPDASAGLGALIDELRRSGRTELLVEASWLYQHRIAVEPLAGLVRAECDADGHRACAIASRIAQSAGLVTASQAAACETGAAWQASDPASSALLRLDRASHRIELGDWLERPPRVLVALVHGEVGQGHDHFADIMACQLRSASSGGWRELPVAWPPPSRSLGTRLAMLVDALAAGLGIAPGVPADDPATPDGARAWRLALDRIADAIDAAREPVLVRHTVGWLATRAATDDALVDAYLHAVWATVAQRSGERVVVGLDVRRAERAGRPLTRTLVGGAP